MTDDTEDLGGKLDEDYIGIIERIRANQDLLTEYKQHMRKRASNASGYTSVRGYTEINKEVDRLAMKVDIHTRMLDTFMGEIFDKLHDVSERILKLENEDEGE